MSQRGNIPGPLFESIIAALALPALSTLMSYVFLSIALIGGVIYIIGVTLGRSSFIFVGQMLVVMAMFCLTPTIAQKLAKNRPKIIKRTLETLILMLMFMTFTYWLFGRNVFGVWMVYSMLTIGILNMGGYCIEHYQSNIENRISNNTSLESLKVGIEIAQQTLGFSVFLYIAFPTGILLGIIAGLIRETRREDMIILCVKITLILSVMTLIVLLFLAFKRMIKPFKKQTHEMKIVTVRDGKEEVISTTRTTIFDSYGKPIRIVQNEQKENLDEQNLSIAYVITDLRKLYLFDAVHNSILFISLFILFTLLQNINLGLKLIILGSLLTSLVFNQIPYIIGQLLLHESILSNHEGVRRAEMTEKLKKIAPLFPTVDFLAAMTTTGTAGGLTYFLLDKLIKDAFK